VHPASLSKYAIFFLGWRGFGLCQATMLCDELMGVMAETLVVGVVSKYYVVNIIKYSIKY
jgi:hypothetical protein